MIVEASATAKPHFFLLGTRVDPGSVASDGSGEKVAVLVARDVLGLDGSARQAGPVLQEDQPLAAAWSAGPFRYEAEIAPYKPEPDAVVVADAGAGIPQNASAKDAQDVLDASHFGSVAIDRGAGFGAETPLKFGWRSRLRAPRVGLAGQAASFDPATQALPVQFRNAFFNGQPLGAQGLLLAGQRLRFTDTANVQHTVTIPAAPVLRVVDGSGAPLQPPAPMVPRADTVVLDRGAGTFTVVWRAVLHWEERLKQAKLVVA